MPIPRRSSSRRSTRASFEPFATYVVNSGNVNSLPSTLQNIRIKAGTNPTFNDVLIEGVVFVETPNNVKFTGNATLQGVIVTQDAGAQQHLRQQHHVRRHTTAPQHGHPAAFSAVRPAPQHARLVHPGPGLRGGFRGYLRHGQRVHGRRELQVQRDHQRHGGRVHHQLWHDQLHRDRHERSHHQPGARPRAAAGVSPRDRKSSPTWIRTKSNAWGATP